MVQRNERKEEEKNLGVTFFQRQSSEHVVLYPFFSVHGHIIFGGVIFVLTEFENTYKHVTSHQLRTNSVQFVGFGSSHNKMRFRASIKEIGTFSSETFSLTPSLVAQFVFDNDYA